MGCTIGGYPESDALHWTAEQKLRLGDIVYRATSSDSKVRRGAYIDFYDMRRHFMWGEWTQYISQIDSMRSESTTLPPIDEQMAECREEIVGNSAAEPDFGFNVAFSEDQAERICDTVDPELPNADKVSAAPVKQVIGEQLSLF